MLCYVVFYIIVYLARRLSVNAHFFFVFMIFLGMGINTYGINLAFLNSSSCRGYYAFFFGLLLAECNNKFDIGNRGAIICILILLSIMYLIVFHIDFMENGINYIMTFIFYPALIILCKSKVIGKIFNRKIIGKIGKISFDVYIWHNPLFLLLYICIDVFNWNLNLNSYDWICIVLLYCWDNFLLCNRGISC